MDRITKTNAMKQQFFEAHDCLSVACSRRLRCKRLSLEQLHYEAEKCMQVRNRSRYRRHAKAATSLQATASTQSPRLFPESLILRNYYYHCCGPKPSQTIQHIQGCDCAEDKVCSFAVETNIQNFKKLHFEDPIYGMTVVRQ